jgi:hypothetical protein
VQERRDVGSPPAPPAGDSLPIRGYSAMTDGANPSTVHHAAVTDWARRIAETVGACANHHAVPPLQHAASGEDITMSTHHRKKLALHRETLRTISGVNLADIHGGVDTQACTLTVETRLCDRAWIHDKLPINDTVYRPGDDQPGQNDTVYRGGGRVIPL